MFLEHVFFLKLISVYAHTLRMSFSDLSYSNHIFKYLFITDNIIIEQQNKNIDVLFKKD